VAGSAISGIDMAPSEIRAKAPGKPDPTVATVICREIESLNLISVEEPCEPVSLPCTWMPPCRTFSFRKSAAAP
jgi:hypothetical protein